MNDDQIILHQRAKLMASGRAETTPMGESLLVVEFMLIPETYCIASSFISEVVPLLDITLVPGAPAFVMGIMNVRGKIISVVNLKRFFGLKETGISGQKKIIIIKLNLMEFGIVADAINGTKEVALNSLSAPPPTLTGFGAEFIRGVTPDGLILLEAATILTSKPIIVNQK